MGNFLNFQKRRKKNTMPATSRNSSSVTTRGLVPVTTPMPYTAPVYEPAAPAGKQLKTLSVKVPHLKWPVSVG